MATPRFESVITCPRCGGQKAEIMPVNACVHRYQCNHCHHVLRPIPGDCCVFCSFGSVGCPPCESTTGESPVVVADVGPHCSR